MTNRLTIALLLVCISCVGDEPLAPKPSLSESQIETAPTTIDEEFQFIEKSVPGFGGYFIRDGELHGYLTDLRVAKEADRVLLGHLAGRSFSGGRTTSATAAITWHQGRFSFQQLNDWRRTVANQVMNIAGVLFSDVDEVGNVVMIGIEGEQVRGVVLSAIEQLQLPREAVTVTVAGPLRPLLTLSDSIRPVPGGVRIRNDQGTQCTLGPAIRFLNGSVRFLMNSHCTPVMFAVDATVIHQPTCSPEPARIGREVWDTTYFGNMDDPACPASRRCRYSDIALGLFDTSVGVDFGKIARTDSSGRYSGSLNISFSNPRFSIIGNRSFPTVGEELHRIGASSGWTRGPVTRTCVHINYVTPTGAPTNITFVCQDEFDTGGTNGDSGSPVFGVPDGNNVIFYGVMWGGQTPPLTRKYFSSFSLIREDVGAFYTY